ncbi:MAG: methionyl-tRNA formyltransferase [Patescibacteria group bacterium]
MKRNPKSKLSFAFWGTPEIAKETLEILKQSGFLPSLIVTSADKPKGRKLEITPPPVKVWAIENKIPCIQPEKLESDMLVPSDLSIVVAYGKIIPEEILNAPKLGSINVHYSLLPKYRGASPVESAILAGETETGVTIQKMVYKLDSGPILAQEKVKIGPDETAPALKKRLTGLGAEMLVELLKDMNRKETSQEESKATYCKKITKADGEIDLNNDPLKNYNKFRAYNIWPRTYFMKNGKRVIITSAALKDGKFLIKKVIPEGGKETDFSTFR